jgi:TonB family protein
MSYQALLFCPDEKTARVVSQVLSELEFHVEPCNEPFAAVKKLMAQHFDAIVVDCDNEQNAALLFKSARNSNSNQASLAVAVVEGQAGVAKAFRIGANLVLTKPIHVEQSKGTLRVARGLLRKGQTAKPGAGVVTPAESPVAQQPSPSAPSVSTPAPSFPTPFASAPASSAQFASQHSSTPPPMASASAFELDAEPAPQPDAAEATLLEYMPDSAPSGADKSPRASADSSPSKQYPWQPRSKPQAEPMASALRRAAEAAGKIEFEAPASSSAALSTSSASISAASMSSAPTSKSGAAAAPARAKEALAAGAGVSGLKPAVKTASLIAPGLAEPEISQPEIAKITEPVAEGSWDSNPATPSVEEIRFSSLGEYADREASGAGGSKKTLLLVVALLAVVAAGYFGWTKMQPTHSQPAPQAVAPANLGTAVLPPQASPAATDTQAAPDEVVAQAPEQSLGTPVAGPSSSKPSAAVMAEGPGVKASVPAKTPAVANDVTVIKAPGQAKPEQPETLVVKNSPAAETKAEPEPQEPDQAPAPASIAPDSSSNVLSGLVNTNAVNVQKAPAQTLRLSQGVSQGLLIKRVQPEYPAQARQMRLEGKVELQANISKTGSITAVKQLSGDGTLGRAAIDAVRQWKYKPYYLNGEPIEIQTQITVNFKLP